MSKGKETRTSILNKALELSTEVGLEGLTVGALAKKVGMSKSGLYAHFESKEDLQCQVLDTAAAKFVDVVVARALKQPRGLPRLRALFVLWLDWATKGLSGGCPFVSASTEFDDRSGPVRDRVVAHLGDLIGTIVRSVRICVEEGDFREDLDVDQFAFEVWAMLLAFHHYARLFRRKDASDRVARGFERLVQDATQKK